MSGRLWKKKDGSQEKQGLSSLLTNPLLSPLANPTVMYLLGALAGPRWARGGQTPDHGGLTWGGGTRP